MPNDIFRGRRHDPFEINDPDELAAWTTRMALAGIVFSLAFIIAFVH